MKRFAIAGAAALMLTGPLTGVAAAVPQHNDLGGRPTNGNDRDRNERNDHRNDRNERNGRNATRFDQSRYNGYYVNGRWNYGPPSAQVMRRSDYRPGYVQWRRGERLPSYYRTQYREVDWRHERLRQPPRGYHYVRDDRGEVLLVAVATGLILSILMNQ